MKTLLIKHLNDLLAANYSANLIAGYSLTLDDSYVRAMITVVIERDDFKEFVEIDVNKFFANFEEFRKEEFITDFKSMTLNDDGTFSFEEDSQFMWAQELANTDAFIEAIDAL